MNFKKVNIDRKQITQEEIEQHQDFDKILESLKRPSLTKKHIVLKTMFYGILSFVVILGVNFHFSTHQADSKQVKSLDNSPKKFINAKTKPSGFVDEVNTVSENIEAKEHHTTKQIIHKQMEELAVPEIALDRKEELPKKSQLKPSNIELITEHPMLIPSVNGVQDGRLLYSDFIESPIIEIGEGYRVVSFNIDLQSKREGIAVSGNRFPEAVMHEFSLLPKSIEFTLTKIIIEDKVGTQFLAPSMRLNLIK